MAFWQYTQSNIQTLLEKQDVTPQQILSESDVLQELRGHSANLIEYLLEPRILEQLVDIITHDPDPQMDYKVQYKLPNTACEVLTFDIPAIKDALIGSPQVLTKVCNVFRQEDALNDLTASFVCKLLIPLITKRTDKFIDFIRTYDPDRYQSKIPGGKAGTTNEKKPVVEAVQPKDQEQLQPPEQEQQQQEEQQQQQQEQQQQQQQEQQQQEQQQGQQKQQQKQQQEEQQQQQQPKPQEAANSSAFVDMLLNHINNSAIKDLINKMVECSENPEFRPKVVEWLSSAHLVPKLVAMLSADNSEQVITNSAKCLCKIVKIGREQQMALQDKCPPDPLLASIEQVQMITEIVEHATPTGQDDLSSACTLFESNFVLLALLQYKKTTPCFQDLMDPKCFLGLYSPPTETSPTLGELDHERAKEAIRKCLAAITARLDSLVVHLSQEQKERFGTVRLEIVKIIAAMVSCGDEPSLIAIRNLKVLPVILDLFFNYPLCSQLHNQVDTIVQAICSPPKSQSGERLVSDESVKLNTTYETSPKSDCLRKDDLKPTASDSVDSTSDDEAASVSSTGGEDTTSGSEAKPPTILKHVLFDQLFLDCLLLEKIVDNYSTVPKDQKGYNGHLRLMANYIEAMSENSYGEYYKQLMEVLSPELRERWTAFKETLESINNVYNKTVCPMNNAASCSEGDDPEDLRDMGVPSAEAIASAQQALNDYQMNMLTACSIDKFGFEDDEFTDVDIPGITNVAVPPIEDDSSDEEDSGGENCDPWNKMDEGFNPWNLAGSSGGDETQDDWADFGSVKTDLGIGAHGSEPPSSEDKTSKESDSKSDDDNWADFASFRQSTAVLSEEMKQQSQQQQQPQQQPQQQRQSEQRGSDDEF